MRTLTVILIAGLLAACGNPRQAITAQLAEQVLLPAHHQWLEANQELRRATQDYCEGRAQRAALERAFHGAQRQWAYLQPQAVGPLSEGNRAWEVQFYPDKRNLVARQAEALLDQHPDLTQAPLDDASVVIQGLTAFEYLAFDDKANLAKRKDRYCPMLRAIARHQVSLAEDVVGLWQGGQGMKQRLTDFPNDRYATVDEALGGILRVQVTAIDTLKKKLGTPMGRRSNGVPQPYQAEAWRSRRSIDNLQAAVAGARAVWEPVRPLVGDAALVSRIDQAYQALEEQLADLPAPLVDLVEKPEHRAPLKAVYASLDKLEALHHGELAPDLGIQLGFNANDGD